MGSLILIFIAVSFSLGFLLAKKTTKSNKELDLHRLVSTNIAASVIIQKRDAEVVLCSPYTRVLTGHSIDEVLRHSADGSDFIESLIHEEERESYRVAKQNCLQGEEVLVRYRIRSSSGLSLWLETRLVPVCDSNGNISATLSVTTEITGLMKYQHRIEQQNRDLSDFAYMVSHDLKAPIFTVKGMASALLEDHGSALDPQGQELIQFIVDGTLRLEDVVGSVIEYSSASQITSDKISSVPLKSTLDSVCKDLEDAISSGKVKINKDELTDIYVLGNEAKIYRLLMNLVSNAVKYRDTNKLCFVTISAVKRKENIELTVSDNGIGIPQDKLEDIFRPYQRVHTVDVDGNGIGLACVKKIVDQLEGEISVKSSVGEGTVFTLVLPSTEQIPRETPVDIANLYSDSVANLQS